eukprot:m.317885 g.317885  ORF g.317885 m.317885 type:complete len:328 (-) comp15987_c2_seq2:109-1092(-)
MANNTTGFCHEALKESQCQSIVTLQTFTAALSFTGCFVTLLLAAVLKRWRYYAERLILSMTIAALLDALPYFLVRRHDVETNRCTAQAFLMTYFDWSVLLWICCMTINVYANFARKRSLEHFERWFHAICWGVPLIFACIPFGWSDGYGPAGVWCWITVKHPGLQFGVWYAPMLILILAVVVIYAKVHKKVLRQGRAYHGFDSSAIAAGDEAQKEIGALRLYPLVYLFLSIFSVINRIQNAARPHSPIFALFIMQVCITPLQGFINVFVYRYASLGSKDIWKELRRCCSSQGKVQHLPYSLHTTATDSSSESFGDSDGDELYVADSD